jgi:hypothetical protein
MRVPKQYPKRLLAGGITAALAATLAGAPALAAQPGTTPGELDVDLVPVAMTGEVMFMNFDSFEGDSAFGHTEAYVVLDDGRVFLVNDNVSEEDGLVAGAQIEATLLIPAETAEALPAADQADLQELVAEATPEPASEAGIEALAVNEPAVDALLDAAAEEGGLYALSRDYNVLVDPYPAPNAADFNRVFDVAVITPDGTWEATDAEIRTMVEKTEQDWSTQTVKSFNWTVSEIKRLSTTITNANTGYETLMNEGAKAFGHTDSNGTGDFMWYRSSPGRQLLVFLPANEFEQPPPWNGVSMGLGQGVGSGGVVGLDFTANQMMTIAGDYSYTAEYLRIATHEMGHVMGLHHATTRTCLNAPSTGTWNEANLGYCTYPTDNDAETDYRDHYSVMGTGLYINPTLRYELNLLDDSQVTVIDSNVTSQRVTLRSPTGTTGVLVLAVAGAYSNDDYLFEYRAIPSTDSVSGQVGGDGVRVIRLTRSNKTYLHEETPGGSSKLPSGRVFESEDGVLSVTLISQDASKAVLSVTTRGYDDCGDYYFDACSWTLSPYGATTITKGLQRGVDTDTFRFTAPMSGEWSFYSSGIPTGTDIRGGLKGSDGTTLLAEDDNSNGDRNFKITYTLTKDAVYYLRVDNAEWGTANPANPYTITARPSEPSVLVPTPTVSGVKTVGYTLSASVFPLVPAIATKDYQWYRGTTPIAGATGTTYKLVAADAGQSIKVRVTGWAVGYTTAHSDSTAYVIAAASLAVSPTTASLPYTASTTSAFTVTTNQASWSVTDDAAWLTTTKSTSSFTARATANTLTTPRTATVTVTAGAATPVTFTVTQAGKDDCGSSTSSYCSWALSSTLASTITRRLELAADEDWIRFTAPVAGSWTFAASGTPSGSDIYGYLLNSSGTQLAYDDDSNGNRNFKITYTLTANTVYYLRVRNYSSTTTVTADPYSITATPPARTVVVPTPTVSGTKTAGYTVSAVVGATTPVGATKMFQWYRGSTAISGATSSQYLLKAADAGQSIKVRVTGTYTGYVSAYAESAAYTIAAANLSVSRATYTFSSSVLATSSAFTVTTNQASWSVTDDADWLTVTKSTSSFTVRATANTSTTPRSATVTVRAGEATPVTVTVTQPGVDDCGSSTTSYCSWTLSQTAPSTITRRLGTAADEDWIRFTAPISGSWTFAASGTPSGSDIYGYLLNSSGTQLAYDDDSNGNRNFKITYTLTANTVYFLRVRNYSSTTYTTADPYTITATPPVATLSVSPTTTSLPATASSSAAFTVTTNQLSWSVTDNATWLTVTRGTSVFVANAIANTSATARTATITVSAGTATPVTVTVTQAGAVTDDCGSSTTSYCSWALSSTATSTITRRLEVAADEDWIRFTAPIAGSWTFAASGTPSGADTYGYLLNSSGSQLAYDDDGNGSYNFKITYTLTAGTVYFLRVRNYSSTTSTTANPYTITATPPVPTLSVSPTTYTFGSTAAATSSIIWVSTNQSSWSVTESATWLTVTQYSSYFTVRATTNTGVIMRRATVTISAGAATPVTLTVTQPGTRDVGI